MLRLLHTAKVHRATFDALRDQLAPGLVLEHDLRTDWLKRAQDGISPELAGEIERCVRAYNTPVLCTCTTLGSVAEAAGAVRIDGPMMQAAVRTGGPILMTYCLESTQQPSRALLDRAIAGRAIEVRMLSLADLWPLFEAGELKCFAAEIATRVREEAHDIACVVLAQASMAGAAAYLGDLEMPVLSSPELAFRAMLERLGQGLQNL